MNSITPAIDAFVASGTCAVLISLLVITMRNRKMTVRPRSNSYYASPVRQTGRPGLNDMAAHAMHHQPSPNLPSGLLARNGFNHVPPKREKTMDRETFGNKLVAPLNFQVAGFSSGIPLEANTFSQEAPQSIAPNESLPQAVPPPAIVENLSHPTAEERIVDVEVRPAQEMKAAAESNLGDESGRGLDLFTQNSEGEPAKVEVKTSAICVWDGERHGARVPNGLSHDSFMPAAMSAATEIAPMPESRTDAPVEEDAEPPKNMDVPEEFAGVELEAPRTLPLTVAEAKSAEPTLLSFHGLKQQPFDVTPDPSYLYFSPSHREALTSISEGIENFRGFMTLVAEPGMGKTTLLNKLMEELSDSARVVFLFQTQCNSNELLAFILNELEVDHAGMDVVAMHRALNQVLLEEMLRGRRFVLIVDEGQNLQDSVLETIRLLSDFETAHSKLIQIVLAGQPQLVDTLMRPNLVQLRQRIAVLSSLKALNAAETSEYVEFRLRAAGWNGQQLFTPDALQAIAELSGGVPRTINNLCFNALLKAFTRRQDIIDAGIVKEVGGKLQLDALARRPEKVAVPQTPAQHIDRSGAAQIVRALSAALGAAARPNAEAEPGAKRKSNPGVVVTGKLIEKISCQSWSKKHEYRLDVSFERDPIPGISVADRHYCCNFYIGEEEAATLQVGKPIRIRIEQD
jgi:general secretion pathway protein A